MLPRRLAVCIAFHFNDAKLGYLARTAAALGSLGCEVSLHVVTNSAEPARIDAISAAISGNGLEHSLFVPHGLGHPFLLPWSHLHVFRGLIEDRSLTHFMYLEDDILVTRANVEYWLRGREQLRASRLIPSFLRVERKVGDPTWYSTDVTSVVALDSLPHVPVATGYAYVNLRQPYQGMYLLDRELMVEHLSGPSSNPDFGPWMIREKAAQGITFLDVPQGFTSRNAVGFHLPEGEVDESAFVHHMPDNYANNAHPENPFGRLPAKWVVEV